MPNISAQANLYKTHVMAFWMSRGAWNGIRSTACAKPIRSSFRTPRWDKRIRPSTSRPASGDFFAKYLYYTIRCRYKATKNQAFFINDTLRPVGNYFTVVYDDMSTPYVTGEIGFMKGENCTWRSKAIIGSITPKPLPKLGTCPKLT